MAVGAQSFDIGTAVAGRVRHVGIYGALVDIGTGLDAMLHISQLANGERRRFEEVVRVDDEINAYVLKTRRDGYVALTMEKPPSVPWQSIKQGNTYMGEVIRVENYGVFVEFGAERPGMVHVSELSDSYVKSPGAVASIGQEVEVRVIKKNDNSRKIDLSMKKDEQALAAVEEEDEDEGDVPTSMAQAFRRAMGSTEEKLARNSRRSARNDHRSRQEEILARTLRGT